MLSTVVECHGGKQDSVSCFHRITWSSGGVLTAHNNGFGDSAGQQQRDGGREGSQQTRTRDDTHKGNGGAEVPQH